MNTRSILHSILALAFLPLASLAAEVPKYSFEVVGPLKGLEPEAGVCRRDPSDIVKLGELYYLFYTKLNSGTPVYPEGYYGEIWYATSRDSDQWQEQGVAIAKGPAGTFDSFGVFTPGSVVWEGYIYLAYTGVGDGFTNRGFGAEQRTAFGMVRLTLDDEGLIQSTQKFKDNEPFFETTPAETGYFDSFRIDDAVFVIRDYDSDGRDELGLYYKGRPYQKTPKDTQMSMAIAESPTKPFVRACDIPRYKLQPGEASQKEGHEVMVWPEGEGITSVVSNAGRGIYFAEDGVNMTKIYPQFQGRINAPGAYRPDISEPKSDEPIRWGVGMVHSRHPHLVKWVRTDIK